MIPPFADGWRRYAGLTGGVQARLREWANRFAAGRPAGAGAWRRSVGVALAAGICLGVLGPFGTYLNGSLAVRTGYWVATLLGGTCILLFAWDAGDHIARRMRWRPSLVAMVASLLAAVPIAMLSYALAVRVWTDPVRAVPSLVWYVQTLIITGILTLVNAGFSKAPLAAPPAPPSQGAAGDFRARLPPHLGREVLALQMEDHYVRAHTRLGSALILIPLHQAVRELGGVPGLRIHRSWWVARAAVAGAVQQGRSVRLRLSNGMEAPVARAAVAEVRAAGWLG